MYYFFFSSRRRHTRFDCDWSSDVCSSDLGGGAPECRLNPESTSRPSGPSVSGSTCLDLGVIEAVANERAPDAAEQSHLDSCARSEERRVGKECRSRWSPDH